MSGQRQAVALDGVTNKANRTIVVDVVERLQHRHEIVAGEIGHELREVFVGIGVDEARGR